MTASAPPAGAWAAATVVAALVLDDGEYAPSGAGEPIAMSMVLKRRSDSNRVAGTVGSRAASRSSGVEMSRCRAGAAAGVEITAGVTMRPQLGSRQTAGQGRLPVMASQHTERETDGGGTSASRVGSKVLTEREAAGVRGAVWLSRPVADLAACGRRRGQGTWNQARQIYEKPCTCVRAHVNARGGKSKGP